MHIRIALGGSTLHQCTKSTRENLHTVAAVDVVVTLVVVVVVVALVVVDEEHRVCAIVVDASSLLASCCRWSSRAKYSDNANLNDLFHHHKLSLQLIMLQTWEQQLFNFGFFWRESSYCSAVKRLLQCYYWKCHSHTLLLAITP